MGGSFRQQKIYKPQKEFAYRMRAAPTSAMSKPIFLRGDGGWWVGGWVGGGGGGGGVWSLDVFPWCVCGVDVMRCDVMRYDVMWLAAR